MQSDKLCITERFLINETFCRAFDYQNIKDPPRDCPKPVVHFLIRDSKYSCLKLYSYTAPVLMNLSIFFQLAGFVLYIGNVGN